MKHSFLKASLLTATLFLVTASMLTGCKKDNDNDKGETPAEQTTLDGKWEVSSFTIGGVEVKGQIIAESGFEFEVFDAAKGHFSWSIIYTDNTADYESGDYELTGDEGATIVLKDDEGFALSFDYVLDGDQLRLSGNMDEGIVVIEAERR